MSGLDFTIEELLANDYDSVDEEFLEDFFVEAKEHIENIEMKLLELEKNSSDPEIINSIFRSYHTIKGLAGFVSQLLIQKIAHTTETLMDLCRNSEISATKKIIDIILLSTDLINKICQEQSLNKNENFIKTACSHLEYIQNVIENKGESFDIEAPLELEELSVQQQVLKLGEILENQDILDEEDIQDILEKQNENTEMLFGEIAVKDKKATPKDVVDAIRTQTKVNTNEYMRVPLSKIELLTNMIGELMITHSVIEQSAINKTSTETNSTSSNFLKVSRITKDLQNLAMNLKMVSLKSTFQKISRIARDTISELDKNIMFITQGENTEIDRSVTEKILEPLVHLVKNAISHGIESERTLNNKVSQGLVTVSAYSKRGFVYIEVADDGKGLNTEKLYQKALEKNLIDPNRNYSDKEIQEFILLPGFSTAEKVDNISGRGVGMDVVKTEVQKIGGKLDINSQVNKGTTFILKLPINNAVMNGTIVNIDKSNYIIPTINVKQIIQPKAEQWIYMQNKQSMIKVREDVIPVIDIWRIFDRKKTENYRPELIIILEMEHILKALPIDSITGRQEIVLKPLGEEFKNLNFFSGSSILADGTVSLIFDIENLFKMDEGAF